MFCSRKKFSIIAAFLTMLLTACGTAGSPAAPQQSPALAPDSQKTTIKTVNPGFITVAFNGDMPMTSLKDNQLSGTDGSILREIAQRLNLQIKPVQIDWAGGVEAVKSGRVDVLIGAAGWTPARAKELLLTDPIYYFGTMVLQKETANIRTVADFKGKVVGTVTGFAWVPDLEKMAKDGSVKEAKTYETTDAAIRDLMAGRLDAALVDSPLGQWIAKTNPDWKLKQVPLEGSDARYAIFSHQYQIVIAVNKQFPELHDAVNGQIREMWKSGRNRQIMAEFGLGDDIWFKPNQNERAGVDRPQDWAAPILSK